MTTDRDKLAQLEALVIKWRKLMDGDRSFWGFNEMFFKVEVDMEQACMMRGDIEEVNEILREMEHILGMRMGEGYDVKSWLRAYDMHPRDKRKIERHYLYHW